MFICRCIHFDLHTTLQCPCLRLPSSAALCFTFSRASSFFTGTKKGLIQWGHVGLYCSHALPSALSAPLPGTDRFPQSNCNIINHKTVLTPLQNTALASHNTLCQPLLKISICYEIILRQQILSLIN